MDKSVGNQQLQFNAEIWKNYENLPPYVKKYKVQIVMDK